MNKKLLSSIIVGTIAISGAAFAKEAAKPEAKKDTKIAKSLKS